MPSLIRFPGAEPKPTIESQFLMLIIRRHWEAVKRTKQRVDASKESNTTMKAYQDGRYDAIVDILNEFERAGGKIDV